MDEETIAPTFPIYQSKGLKEHRYSTLDQDYTILHQPPSKVVFENERTFLNLSISTVVEKEKKDEHTFTLQTRRRR